MKKALRTACLVLALILMAGLCGCSSKKVPEEEIVPPSLAPHSPAADPSPENSPANDPALSDSPAPSVAPEEPSTILAESEDMGQEYIDQIVFLGDSTTYGLRYYKMLSGGRETTQVWTPSSGTLTLSQQSFALIVYPEDDSEITILDAVAKKKPAMMVITLGVNGVSFMDEAYFKSEYTALVEGIQQTSPDTKIILQSIFPVAENYEYLGDINNENITQANKWVLDIAEATGVRYLDTQTVLKGADGWLPQEYQNGDGLHLNETSFALVLDYIRTHGYK